MSERRGEFRRLATKHLNRFQRFEEHLFLHPLLRVPFFIVGFIVLRLLIDLLTTGTTLGSHLRFVWGLILGAYFLLLLFYVLRHSLRSLFTAKSLLGLVVSYVLFIISILFLFAAAYAWVSDGGSGYLTYGGCSDTFSPEAAAHHSESYFYFAASTLFTVGYGDICPMGSAKIISVLNAFAGNIITVLVMGIVISAYFEKNWRKDK